MSHPPAAPGSWVNCGLWAAQAFIPPSRATLLLKRIGMNSFFTSTGNSLLHAVLLTLLSFS